MELQILRARTANLNRVWTLIALLFVALGPALIGGEVRAQEVILSLEDAEQRDEGYLSLIHISSPRDS